MWPECSSRGLRYLNTALEQWEDGEDATSYPKNADEAYKLTLGFIKDEAKNKKHWTSKVTLLARLGTHHLARDGLQSWACVPMRKERARGLRGPLPKNHCASRSGHSQAQAIPQGSQSLEISPRAGGAHNPLL